MATFDRGETVICSVTVTDAETLALTDPATSMLILIKDRTKAEVVAETAMTNDSTGKYHFDYNSSASAVKGTYTITYKATDGTRITITFDTFELE